MSGRAFHLQDQLRWTVDGECVKIVDPTRDCNWTLEGDEAVLWQLLHNGLSMPAVQRVMTALSSDGVEDCPVTVAAIFANWEQQKLIVFEDGGEG